MTISSNTLSNNKLDNQNSVFTLTSNLHNTVLFSQLTNLNSTFRHAKNDLSIPNQKYSMTNLFVSLSEVDLLKSVNLNIINTLTLPITNKDTLVNNYTVVLPLVKKRKFNFKK